MSAWLVSQDHLNLIVNASELPNELWFGVLLRENLRSLSQRYGEKEIEENEGKIAQDFKFERIDPAELIKRVYAEKHHSAHHYPAVGQPVTPERIAAQIRQSCDSFDYQSCETEDYYETPAAQLVKLVREANTAPEEMEREALWSF